MVRSQFRTSIAAILFLFASAASAQEDVAVPKVVQEHVDEPDGQDRVFTIIEKMPEFPGGPEAMFKYLGQNIKCPGSAIDAGIQGTVYVSFVVDTSGAINATSVLRGIGGGCDEEALRVVNGMPLWVPGKDNGKPVKVQYNMRYASVIDEQLKRGKKN